MGAIATQIEPGRPFSDRRSRLTSSSIGPLLQGSSTPARTAASICQSPQANVRDTASDKDPARLSPPLSPRVTFLHESGGLPAGLIASGGRFVALSDRGERLPVYVGRSSERSSRSSLRVCRPTTGTIPGAPPLAAPRVRIEPCESLLLSDRWGLESRGSSRARRTFCERRDGEERFCS